MSIKDVPNITWQYYGWIDFMTKNPGVYGSDDRRTELHKVKKIKES